jgi:release factor glutamine methyltransferase
VIARLGIAGLMTLGNSLNSAIEALTRANVGSPRMNAELLLMFTLGCDRAHLYTHPERSLTADEQSRYEDALSQRSRGVPAQYITGHQEFWGLDLIVSPSVLIPRPETEHVIETVLDLARDVPAPRIVDVGTGSGCIALALAKELPHAEIHAVDISPDALEVARANAARHDLNSRIHFHGGDLLTAFPKAEHFDFIVSNPPYVGESDEDQVQMEVRKFEPRAAVFAGPSGLEVIGRLIPQAQPALKPGGWLVMEIGQGQDKTLRQLLQGWNDIRFVKDLQGIQRVVAARHTA